MTTHGDVRVRAMCDDDAERVLAIYDQGIATGEATFETAAPAWQTFCDDRPSARLVATLDGRVVAWATLSPISSRCCYEGVVEDSIYVASEAQGRGVGRLLLQALIERSEEDGIWTIQAGMFPENAASVRLHLACGFRTVGVFERFARQHGVWRDVLYLERRSSVI